MKAKKWGFYFISIPPPVLIKFLSFFHWFIHINLALFFSFAIAGFFNLFLPFFLSFLQIRLNFDFLVFQIYLKKLGNRPRKAEYIRLYFSFFYLIRLFILHSLGLRFLNSVIIITIAAATEIIINFLIH